MTDKTFDAAYNYVESSQLLYASAVNVMHTRLDIIMVGVEKEQGAECWHSLLTEVRRLERLFSKFDEGSELYKLNNLATMQATAVEDDELWNVLIECRRHHQLTRGYFDISLADLNHVEFDLTTHSIRFDDPHINLDLGGYAKGYALESFRTMLRQAEVNCALVNFGNSSVLGVGTHPYGNCWPVGVNNPYEPATQLTVIQLRDNAMSTSGNMPSHTAHICNPHTGEWTEERRLVTVKAPNAADAEVLSTTLMLLPKELSQQVLSAYTVDEYHTFSV